MLLGDEPPENLSDSICFALASLLLTAAWITMDAVILARSTARSQAENVAIVCMFVGEEILATGSSGAFFIDEFMCVSAY